MYVLKKKNEDNRLCCCIASRGFGLARLDKLAQQGPDGSLTGVRSLSHMLPGVNIMKVLGSKQKGEL